MHQTLTCTRNRELAPRFPGPAGYNSPMKESTYIRMVSALHSHPALEHGVVLANALITYAIYLAYPCLIAWLFISEGWPAAIIDGDWSTFAVPAATANSTAITPTGQSLTQAVGIFGLANASADTPIAGPAALIYALLIPGISFVLVSIVRRLIDAPRPYTMFNTPPVIPKDTRGNSFPSRHAFSIFIIGMTFYACCPLPWAGPAVLALGCVLAALRVIGGVHFPRDVIAGAALGIALGWLGFWVL